MPKTAGSFMPKNDNWTAVVVLYCSQELAEFCRVCNRWEMFFGLRSPKARNQACCAAIYFMPFCTCPLKNGLNHSNAAFASFTYSTGANSIDHTRKVHSLDCAYVRCTDPRYYVPLKHALVSISMHRPPSRFRLIQPLPCNGLKHVTLCDVCFDDAWLGRTSNRVLIRCQTT